jgi:15-cis-phytoene synthase
MTPDQYCQDKAAKSGSSFYYSFMFLPPPQRRAITAFYAFCREVDDVVDECTDISIAATKLAWWEKQVLDLYANPAVASHPVCQALAPHIEPYRIERQHLLDLIAGMRMDLEQTRYLDFTALSLYCHRVAGVVGLVAARIFAPHAKDTDGYAAKLGLALQLTNIIRDVGDDARKGRIYLPVEDLQRFEVPAHQILKATPSAQFTELMRFQTERARTIYREALDLLPETEVKGQRAGLIMAAIYAKLLREIELSGFEVLKQRTSLTPLRKLWIAWTTWHRPLAWRP